MADVQDGTRAYWDAGHIAPPDPTAVQALQAAISEGWADPRRLHREGRAARLLLDGAREALAGAAGFRADEVALFGSFADAVRAGVLGTLTGRRRTGAGLVHSAVEHSTVLAAARWHQSARADAAITDAAATEVAGLDVVEVGVDRLGRVDPDEFCAAIGPRTGLAALQFANGEVGTRQPIETVVEHCRRLDVPLLVDASAAGGQVDLGQAREWADLLLLDARAWGAPVSCGVLLTRAGVRWRAPWPTDPDAPAHSPAAAGSVAIPAALAAAVGLQTALASLTEADTRRRSAIERLRGRLPDLISECLVVGDPDRRLPHLLTFSVLYAEGERLVDELDRAGFAVGSGSACTSSTLRPSHVLAAMGALTQGNVRLALPAATPADVLEQQVQAFESVLPGIVERVRA